jgi:hypothetical protein
VEVIVVFVVVQQTQPLDQIVWPSVLVVGIIAQPPIQRSILDINIKPIVETT